MNANKWPLNEMEREVYTVLYALDEFGARLNQLHELERQISFFPRDGDYVSRTNVISLAEKYPANRAVMYCVQRVRKYRPVAFHIPPEQNIEHVHAEMNVAWQYESGATQVTLYAPTRMTKAQKNNLMQLAASGSVAMIGISLISWSFGGAMVFVPFIFLAMLVYSFISNLLHYARQKRILRRQIMQALTLEPHMKE